MSDDHSPPPGQAVPQGAAPGGQGDDANIANGARIYDYLLGGKNNYVADRVAADRMIAENPGAPVTAKANRAFLGRAVRFLVEEAGIRQFLDVGAGLPTQQNVHEVAQRSAPDARVVYVDHDPVVVAHGQALLATSDAVTVIQADARRPADILDHPETCRLIDFSEPVAVLLVAVLHFVSDEEDPDGILARFAEVMAPGSHLAISHTVGESPAQVMAAAQRGFQGTGALLTPRTRPELRRFFQGFDILEPGLVRVAEWRPTIPPPPSSGNSPWVIVGGVGRKR
ncbi:SAM-dependent methyltransferase [Sphaerisporangium corydalis]|uniref:SAM-dependent methyltransferase n=1 Tax=Sphaerisporangium corydalis TaxID=1441875 RepID=A0ABV9ECE7_9ACTN|nr:SAM-dependent methyltransferase [Sphaerisporangium corydalis]